ncbi:hypothetical protein PO124_14760 [Bacillus licheniformis]|nr:hypothetical protein [Bacillus licheniformis]
MNSIRTSSMPADRGSECGHQACRGNWLSLGDRLAGHQERSEGIVRPIILGVLQPSFCFYIRFKQGDGA